MRKALLLILFLGANLRLSYGGDNLTVKIKDLDAHKGVLTLTSEKLSTTYYPKLHRRERLLDISLVPSSSGVVDVASAEYNIKDSVFEASVPFVRPPAGGNPKEISIYIRVPDKNGAPSLNKFVAKVTILPTKAAAVSKLQDIKQGEESDSGASSLESPSNNGDQSVQSEQPLNLTVRVQQAVFKGFSITLRAARSARVFGMVNAEDGESGKFSCQVQETPERCEAGFSIDAGAAIRFLDEKGQQQGSVIVPPPLVPLWLQTVLGGILALLLLAGFGLGGKKLFRRTRAPKPAFTAPRTQDPQEQFYDANDAKLRRLEIDIRNIKQDFKELREPRKPSASPQSVVPASSEGGLDQIATTLALKLQSKKATAVTVRLSEEDLLLAAVNHWIASASRDRAHLLQLASALNLNARFCTHGDAASIVRDITNFVYPFSTSESDGGWLWLDTSNGESLAIPALIDFFRIGKAPDLLVRLVDGMQNAPTRFDFHCFYRACRFKPASQANGYTLLQQGRVLVEGRTLPSAWQQPPDYHDVLNRKVTHPGAPEVRTSAVLLAEYLQTMESQISKLRRDIEALGSKLIGAEQLKTEAAVQLKPLLEDIAGMRDQIAKLTQTVLQPKIGSDLNLPTVRAMVNDVQRKLLGRIENLESKIDLLNAKDDGLPPEQRISPDPFIAIETPLPPTYASDPPEIQPAVTLWAMPDGWKEAVSGAGTISRLDAPYAERVRNLEKRFGATSGRAASGKLVHLFHRDGNFEIHQAVDREALTCRQCGGTEPTQFAVCIGEDTGFEFGILFPLGSYHHGNYPAGYSALIEKCPQVEFQLNEVLNPARLTQKASGGVYTVSELMRVMVS